MPIGPGKYDEALTAALKIARRVSGRACTGVLLVRGDLPEHDGFSAHLTVHDMAILPAVLRELADKIEADVERGAFSS